ncbi:hypothetical protein GCM10009727_25090 [Actinomadura napierensis]|uniref:Uncharacterized protein n=1 Tax=Actinomadura napierensis TaxID=267854 RepID=A0ABP5KL92_9ACTN
MHAAGVLVRGQLEARLEAVAHHPRVRGDPQDLEAHGADGDPGDVVGMDVTDQGTVRLSHEANAR